MIMQSKVSIEITVSIQEVLITDTPASFRIDLAGQSVAVLPVGPFTADITVSPGNYTGSVTSLRADGSEIGSPVTFTVDATAVVPATVSTVVATGVKVTVTPL
jgi:hypothetical protein